MPASKANDPPRDTFRQAASRVLQRCDELALCTERPGEITRTFCSPAMCDAHNRLREWMAAAGLSVRLDPAGNLIGRVSRESNNPAVRKALLIGSHLDSVVNAGRYDGVLGVMMGLALAEVFRKTQAELPFHLDAIAFCEEEGVRFHTPYIGSRALVGELTAELLALCDERGCTLGKALRDFGGNPDNLAAARYDPAEVVAYIEPHIEQGPVLEQQGLPVGIVTGIAGQTRAGLTFRGQAGHAGTVPIAARRDALVAAAQWIVDVERIAWNHSDLVATVGQVLVAPNVVNVIPGEARLTLDVRHLDDEVRRTAAHEIMSRATEICRQRGIDHTIDWTQEEPAVRCDDGCMQFLEQAVVQSGQRPFRLPSGAGHDAAIMGRRFPACMLFLRCAGGISHHPDEAVSEDDVAAALEVLWRTINSLKSSPLAA